MTKRIVLVRHGRSAHIHRGWIDHEGFRRWRDAYEAAGIIADDVPPRALRDLASSASLIVASHARRAVESARALATGKTQLVSPLFCELDLPALPLRVPMPLPLWALAVGARVLIRRMAGAPRHEADEDERLAIAVQHLNDLAADHETVLVVTHAMVREELTRRLAARGWRVMARESARKHWSSWILERRDG